MLNKILMFAVVLLVFGCAGINQPQKSIVENTYYSQVSPSLKVKFLDGVSYIGEDSRPLFGETSAGINTNPEIKRYFFGTGEKGTVLDPIAEVFIYEINREGIYFTDYLVNIKYIISKRKVNYGGKPFQEVVFLTSYKNVKFFEENGYLTPAISIMRGLELETSPDDQIFCIFYSEEVPSFGALAKVIRNNALLDPTMFDEEQKLAVREFLERAENSILIEKFTEEDISFIQ